jgi:hypothetical protein
VAAAAAAAARRPVRPSRRRACPLAARASSPARPTGSLRLRQVALAQSRAFEFGRSRARGTSSTAARCYWHHVALGAFFTRGSDPEGSRPRRRARAIMPAIMNRGGLSPSLLVKLAGRKRGLAGGPARADCHCATETAREMCRASGMQALHAPAGRTRGHFRVMPRMHTARGAHPRLQSEPGSSSSHPHTCQATYTTYTTYTSRSDRQRPPGGHRDLSRSTAN